MPPKPIDLPSAVARGFVRDMHAYFAETNLIKRDEEHLRCLELVLHGTTNLTARI